MSERKVEGRCSTIWLKLMPSRRCRREGGRKSTGKLNAAPR